MPVTHAVLGLEPGHHFHVFHSIAQIEQIQPMHDGLTILLLDGREYDEGPLAFSGVVMGRVSSFNFVLQRLSPPYATSALSELIAGIGCWLSSHLNFQALFLAKARSNHM